MVCDLCRYIVTLGRREISFHRSLRTLSSVLDKDDVDYIYEEGIAQFCSDLGVDPEDPVLLVLSFHMDAATMCIFTRDEWIRGMESLGYVSRSFNHCGLYGAQRFVHSL